MVLWTGVGKQMRGTLEYHFSEQNLKPIIHVSCVCINGIISVKNDQKNVYNVFIY